MKRPRLGTNAERRRSHRFLHLSELLPFPFSCSANSRLSSPDSRYGMFPVNSTRKNHLFVDRPQVSITSVQYQGLTDAGFEGFLDRL